MSRYRKKPDTFEARRWIPSEWKNEEGWPVIETVWGTSPEAYGIIHATEGDIVVECGGYVSPLATGGYAVYAGADIRANYKQVPVNTPDCNCL